MGCSACLVPIKFPYFLVHCVLCCFCVFIFPNSRILPEGGRSRFSCARGVLRPGRTGHHRPDRPNFYEDSHRGDFRPPTELLHDRRQPGKGVGIGDCDITYANIIGLATSILRRSSCLLATFDNYFLHQIVCSRATVGELCSTNMCM